MAPTLLQQRAVTLGTELLSLIYPPTCVLCGAPGTGGIDLCGGCRADLPWLGPCCARCALPFAAAPAAALCGACQRSAPPFVRCRAAFRYQGPLPVLISGLKFHARMNLLRLCGELLAERLQAEPDAPGACLPDAIVPVPLHHRRLRERGYNQSLEIARVVGQRLQLPVAPECCRRVQPTRPQMQLTQHERLHNVRGAFALAAPLPGAHLAILDDVVTTGGTAAELTRTLQRAGCRRVEVWAIARTP